MSPPLQLRPRQAAFVHEYLKDLNATQAAIRAGYSVKTADQIGLENLRKPAIQQAIQEELEARKSRTLITQDRVLEELAKIGYTDLADVTNWGVREVAIPYDADGKRLPFDQMSDAAVVKYVEMPFITPEDRDKLPPSVRAAIQSVELTRDGFKIKMHDKPRALQLIAQHLGMLVEKREHSGPGGSPLIPAGAVSVVNTFALPDNGRGDRDEKGDTAAAGSTDPVPGE